jgi:hypothetical protein
MMMMLAAIIGMAEIIKEEGKLTRLEDHRRGEV